MVDVVGDGFEGELEGVVEEGEVIGCFFVFCLFFCEEVCEGDDVCVDFFGFVYVVCLFYDDGVCLKVSFNC